MQFLSSPLTIDVIHFSYNHVVLYIDLLNTHYNFSCTIAPSIYHSTLHCQRDFCIQKSINQNQYHQGLLLLIRSYLQPYQIVVKQENMKHQVSKSQQQVISRYAVQHMPLKCPLPQRRTSLLAVYFFRSSAAFYSKSREKKVFDARSYCSRSLTSTKNSADTGLFY